MLKIPCSIKRIGLTIKFETWKKKKKKHSHHPSSYHSIFEFRVVIQACPRRVGNSRYFVAQYQGNQSSLLFPISTPHGHGFRSKGFLWWTQNSVKLHHNHLIPSYAEANQWQIYWACNHQVCNHPHSNSGQGVSCLVGKIFGKTGLNGVGLPGSSDSPSSLSSLPSPG